MKNQSNPTANLQATSSREKFHKQQTKNSQYQFTSNWMRYFTPLWRHYLSEFRGKENIRMLEIDSFEERSAIWFLENILTHNSAMLTCVNPFFDHEQELRFQHNVKISNCSHKLTAIKAQSDHYSTHCLKKILILSTWMAITKQKRC